MSDPGSDRLRADLARAGITPPEADLDATLRTARFLTESARRVRAYLERIDRDASR